jgi:hypothetical protein
MGDPFSIKALEINKGGKMTQEFWRLARREERACPQGPVSDEQRCHPPKYQVRLPPLFISSA